MEEVPEYLQHIAVRLIDEGVPLAATARALKVPSSELREVVNYALDCGRLLDKPREDWPPMQKRSERVPAVPVKTTSLPDDGELLLSIKKVFYTTKLQATVLIPILRRGQCTKETIHKAIEDNRGNAQTATNPKIVDVVICHLRKKLRRFGVSIRTLHALGYSMSFENRQRVIDLIGGA